MNGSKYVQPQPQFKSSPNRIEDDQRDTRAIRANQRVGIIIDVQDLYYGAKDNFGTKIAYGKFMNRVVNGRKLSRAIAYVARRDGNAQDSFIGLLRNIGCDIRQKDIVKSDDGWNDCTWAVETAVDAMVMADKIDVLIIASGDPELVYLLQALRMKGVRTEIAYFRNNVSQKFINEADGFIDVNKDMLISADQAWKKRPEDVATAPTIYNPDNPRIDSADIDAVGVDDDSKGNIA